MRAVGELDIADFLNSGFLEPREVNVIQEVFFPIAEQPEAVRGDICHLKTRSVCPMF